MSSTLADEVVTPLTGVSRICFTTTIFYKEDSFHCIHQEKSVIVK